MDLHNTQFCRATNEPDYKLFSANYSQEFNEKLNWLDNIRSRFIEKMNYEKNSPLYDVSASKIGCSLGVVVKKSMTLIINCVFNGARTNKTMIGPVCSRCKMWNETCNTQIELKGLCGISIKLYVFNLFI